MNPHLTLPLRYSGAPLGPDNPVVFAVHGRGGTPASMEALFERLRWPGATCVAPSAAHQTWYPSGFMDRIERNEPWLSYALDAYGHGIQSLVSQGVGLDRITLMGFSQGACLTAEYAVRFPARYGGLVIFTGGVIGPPGTTWDTHGVFDGTPAFVGTSDIDEWVPLPRVQETISLLRKMGADVTERVYPDMPHHVSDEELEAVRRLLIR